MFTEAGQPARSTEGYLVAGVAGPDFVLDAYLVARSGVLDGRTAVTHWEAAGDMAALQPTVGFNDSALYIDHGDVLASAGIAKACGFGSPVTFRQNFIGAYSTTPTSYRTRFTSR